MVNGREIKVYERLHHPRNSVFENKIDFLIDCLGRMYFDNLKIIETNYFITHRKNLKSKMEIQLSDFEIKNFKGDDHNAIVCGAGICTALSTVIDFHNYFNLDVIETGDGADYIFYFANSNFCCEMKGSTMENCDNVVLKAKSQVRTSFELLEDYDIRFGLVAIAWFSKNQMLYIFIENTLKKNENGKPIMSDDEQNTRKEISDLIFKAKIDDSNGKIDTAKKYYQDAANKQREFAHKLTQTKSRKAIVQFLSAANCALKSNDIKLAFNILEELQANYTLNSAQEHEVQAIYIKIENIVRIDSKYHLPDSTKYQLYKYLIWKCNGKYSQINGKGNIIKMLYDVKSYLLQNNLFLNVGLTTAIDPIWSKEIGDFLEQLVENGILSRMPQKSLKITEKGRKILEPDIIEFEKIIDKKYSADFLKTLVEIVIKWGKMTSKEMEQYERENYKITSKRYMQPLE